MRLNYTITFSIVPLILLYNSERKFVYTFTITDIFGRFLGLKLGEECFGPFIFARILLGMFIFNSYEKDLWKYFILIEIFFWGLLSGALTSIGYYISIKKENKKRKN